VVAAVDCGAFVAGKGGERFVSLRIFSGSRGPVERDEEGAPDQSFLLWGMMLREKKERKKEGEWQC